MTTPSQRATLSRLGRLGAVRLNVARLFAFLLALSALFPSAPRAAPDPDRERAIELFRASQTSYEAGRFNEAAVYLEEAYRLDPNPILLYNLARARESEGDLELALEAYRRYLRESPEAADRTTIEARIAALERQLEDRARLEELVEAERRARERAAAEAERARIAAEARARAASRSGPGVLPWVVTGAGALGLAAGGLLGVLAADRHGAAEAEPVQLEAAALADEADGLALGANIAYAAGGAVAVGGLLWALLGSGDDDGATSTALVVGPSGLAVAGRF